MKKSSIDRNPEPLMNEGELLSQSVSMLRNVMSAIIHTFAVPYDSGKWILARQILTVELKHENSFNSALSCE